MKYRIGDRVTDIDQHFLPQEGVVVYIYPVDGMYQVKWDNGTEEVVTEDFLK